MKKFYKVVAKCGHVGRHYYYEGVFYTIAENGSDAARIVRRAGRVKHDHKDAILSVEVITEEEFRAGEREVRKNPYFNCQNKQEQDLILAEIAGKIKPEPYDDDDDDDNREEERAQILRYKRERMEIEIMSYEKLKKIY